MLNTVNTSFEDIGFAINASGEVAGASEGPDRLLQQPSPGGHLDGHDRQRASTPAGINSFAESASTTAVMWSA